MDRPPDDTRRGRAYAAPEVTVFYDRGRCRHYAECIRGLPQVFDPTRRPWIRADLADAQAVADVGPPRSPPRPPPCSPPPPPAPAPPPPCPPPTRWRSSPAAAPPAPSTTACWQ